MASAVAVDLSRIVGLLVVEGALYDLALDQDARDEKDNVEDDHDDAVAATEVEVVARDEHEGEDEREEDKAGQHVLQEALLDLDVAVSQALERERNAHAQ